jgi:hypothetical protein
MQDAFRLRGTFIGKVVVSGRELQTSFKWPLLLLSREALAHPKHLGRACGNSEAIEAIMVKLD